MNLLPFAARVAIPVICAGLLLPPSTRAADVQYVVKPVAEMKVKAASEGPAVLAGREFSDARAGQGRCARVPLEPGHRDLRRMAVPDC